jgi:pimeloyl-ACP methyl ester carboxylesterase
MANTTPEQTGYAPVNGLKMYYEIHGTGQPLVVLHDAYMTIGTMGELVPSLARTRQVIAVELQARRRTADIDRLLTYEQMADDVAALLRHLGTEDGDIFGYSMGAAASSATSPASQIHSSRCSRAPLTWGLWNAPIGWFR